MLENLEHIESISGMTKGVRYVKQQVKRKNLREGKKSYQEGKTSFLLGAGKATSFLLRKRSDKRISEDVEERVQAPLFVIDSREGVQVA